MTEYSNINFIELALETDDINAVLDRRPGPSEDELWWLARTTINTLHFDAGFPLKVLRQDARIVWQQYSTPWVYGKGIDRTGVSDVFVATQIFLYMMAAFADSWIPSTYKLFGPA